MSIHRREMPAPNGRGILPPVPGLVSATRPALEALPAMRPQTRISVAEAAVQFRKVRRGLKWLDWDNGVAPYMVEPMEMLTSRRFTELYFVGPARSIKTAALLENGIAHAITCNPRRVHVTQMNDAAARDYAVDKLEPMLRHSPELAARMSQARGDQNIRDKRFLGGTRLTIGGPTVAELSSRDIALMLGTDVDRWPEEIGGEGCPVALARKRIQTFESLGMFACESSPGRPVLDEDAKPDHPHGAPKCTGIVGYYDTGTRGRLYVHCPSCSERFQPVFERLDYDRDLDPAEAGRRAVMICPHCGGVIEFRQRPALLAEAVWLHQAADGGICEISGEVRPGPAVSYWLPGPAAVFQRWSELVARYETARRKAQDLESELELKTVVNTDLGLPYVPERADDETPLDAETLQARALPECLRQAPAGTAFLVAAVDVQKNRFVIQVEAVDLELGRTIIDRFEIHAPPAAAPGAGTRAIDPAKYPEDWAALEALETRVYPVQGAGYGLKIYRIGVDTGGAKGSTPNAYGFYRGRRRAGQRDRWYMIKGQGGFEKRRAEFRRPERANQVKGKKAKAAQDIQLLWLGTDLLKDEIDQALRRTDPGGRGLRLAQGLPADVAEELIAERREVIGWRKRPGVTANEALDLAVYCLGVIAGCGAERINADRPPAWARPDLNNAGAVLATEGEAVPIEAPAPRPRRRRGAVLKRR